MHTKREVNDTPDDTDASNPFGADMWLHIATDSLRRYARECDLSVVAQSGQIIVTLPLPMSDPRLHKGFVALMGEGERPLSD